MTGFVTRQHHADPRPGKNRLLLVMLPGAGMTAADFVTQGFVDDARTGETIVDVVAAQPDQLQYLDGSVPRVLADAVLDPAREAGYRRIWLLGISLGGMGALSCASACPSGIEGLILLAPFIGTHGTMAELARAGGFAGWPPAASAATDLERTILAWLKNYLAGPAVPALWLGHATLDRFASGHRLLAAALPRERVVQVEGRHDWTAWRAAFRAIITRRPFG